MNRNQKIALVVGGIFALFIVIVAFSGTGGNAIPPEIASAQTERKEGVFLPRPVTTFELSREISEESAILAILYPKADHTIDVEGTTATLTPTQDLADRIDYTITLYYNKDDETDTVEIGEHEFKTEEFTARRNFLASLPIGTRNYTISRVSERQLYVSIFKGSYEDSIEEINATLSEVGITEDRYDIDIDIFEDEAEDVSDFVH